MSEPDTTVELLVLSDHSNLSSSNTNVSKSNFVSHDNPIVYHTSIGLTPHNYAPTTHTVSPITQLPAQSQGPIALPIQYVSSTHPHVAYQMVIPAQQPMYPTCSFQTFTTPAPGSTGQKTTLPHAFAAGTLHDPTTGAWNMDTGTSSHLNNSVNSLSEIFNTCMYTSISNLISVRQFVRDNNCTIEFDAFGFSVKDFLTHRVLLRCDSTGDLYPVTAPSPIPHAFLVSQHTWHQRLGHPGGEVLRRLVSSNFISCNKEKPPVLCHACQLGKHVRLPFVSSDTVISSCFDIIHSDVWTSPIPSLSGFKYYVLFLDHYSQFVWVYPLVNKSDVMSKFVLFRNYVRTQFKCEIKSFQCDHGGEFDNRRLHTLFAENGIQFRFSCPQTSQQNGKSERMIRTINNLIRTLLFQANLPPTFWVEALNMAIQLLNILPSTAIANDIPYTRLYGKDPNYTLLRIFLRIYPCVKIISPSITNVVGHEWNLWCFSLFESLVRLKAGLRVGFKRRCSLSGRTQRNRVLSLRGDGLFLVLMSFLVRGRGCMLPLIGCSVLKRLTGGSALNERKRSVKASSFEVGSLCRCKKTIECVACLFGRWNRSLGTEENEETTRCKHYGGGSSNRVALDVVGEEVVGPREVEMEMNVSNGMP
ncbi:ribonuclease H-like domain-containing protein [Tanacetum coccineum]